MSIQKIKADKKKIKLESDFSCLSNPVIIHDESRI